MKLGIQIAGAIASFVMLVLCIICLCYTAGNGYHAVQEPNVGDAVVSAGAGAGAFVTGGLATVLAYFSGAGGLIAKLFGLLQGVMTGNPRIDNILGLLQDKEFKEAIAAVFALATAPVKSPGLIKNAVVQGLEAVFQAGSLFIANPAWRTKCAELRDFFIAEFDAQVPMQMTKLDGTPKL